MEMMKALFLIGGFLGLYLYIVIMIGKLLGNADNEDGEYAKPE